MDAAQISCKRGNRCFGYPTEAALMRSNCCLIWIRLILFMGSCLQKEGSYFLCGETRLILATKVRFSALKLDVMLRINLRSSAFRYQRSTDKSVCGGTFHPYSSALQEGRLSCYFRTAFEGLD